MTSSVQRTSNQEREGVKLDGTPTLNKLQNLGYRILLLGGTKNSFMKPRSIFRVFVFLVLGVFQTLYALYELFVALFLTGSLLELVGHGYIATYTSVFNTQWLSILVGMWSHEANEIHLEDFNCTKIIPAKANEFLRSNLTYYIKVMIFSVLWWTTNSMTHIIGPGVDFLSSYIRTGEFISVYIFPPVFEVPRWGQIITYFVNAMTMFSILMYCVGSYFVMGTRVLKIKTVCEILNEALMNDDGLESNLKELVDDHVKIMRNAQEVNKQLATLNTFMFAAVYLEFALQMFCLTLIEADGAYYFATAFDLLSIFLILTFQCWMGSMITHSLQSIGEGACGSKWYERDRRYAKDILFMTQMAQKPFMQKIWFRSLVVERATSLSLVKSSYAAYTVLMILQQQKKEEIIA